MSKRRLLVKALGVTLGMLGLLAISIYVSSQMQLKGIAKNLKTATIQDFSDPDSVRFWNVRLQSLQGSVYERVTSINMYFLKSAKPKDYLWLIRYDPKLLQLCGEVNAKNILGAYVGYRSFYISYGEAPNPFIDNDSSDFAKSMCEIGEDLVVYRE